MGLETQISSSTVLRSISLSTSKKELTGKCLTKGLENKKGDGCYVVEKCFDHRLDFQKGIISPIQILKFKPFPMA